MSVAKQPAITHQRRHDSVTGFESPMVFGKLRVKQILSALAPIEVADLSSIRFIGQQRSSS
jgi:hypothetical protein